MANQDAVEQFNKLKTRLDNVTQDVSRHAGRVQVLKEQFAEKSKQLESFGVSSVDELEVRIKEMQADLSGNTEELSRLLDLYEGGNFKEIMEAGTK